MAAIIRCKMCGGDLALVEGSTIATCEYCGTTQTVPSQDNEKKLALFARANQHRADCEFDVAAGVYEAIVADFPGEAEAYWGLVLCKYGIEYVDDPATGKKIPTCHRSSFDPVMDDKDFEQVMDTADAAARKGYREEAKQIEEIRKGIVAVSAKEDPYDIFICYKETDEKGQRTIDSVMAQDLYTALTDKGYRVFFSRITLEDKLGQEYEPYIFAALNSAKVMLAIGTDYEYFNAVWVKNEWSRYLKLIAKGEKKTLIPCYKDIDAYDMPKEFRTLQAQDLGKMGAIQDIVRNMEKIVPLKGTEAKQSVGGLSTSVTDLLDQGYKAMDSKQWEEADKLFDEVLKISANTPDRFLIEQNVKTSKEQAQFQIRRKKCKKSNIVMALSLALFEIVFIYIFSRDFLAFIQGYADTYVVENVLPVASWIYIGLAVLEVMAATMGMAFVGKTSGAKSGWVTLSRIISVVGMILTFGFAILLKSVITGDDQYVIPTCQFLTQAGISHAVAFVMLFFRKKV